MGANVRSHKPPPSHVHDFATPEGALVAFQRAHAEHDVESAVEALNFVHAAMADLSTKLPTGQVPTPDELARRVAERRDEYRKMLQERGFGKGLDIANCKVISLLERTEEVARFSMTNRDGNMFFSMRVEKETRGWRVVLDG